MPAFVYAPEVTVRITTSKDSRGKGQTIDVSEDVSSGSVTRVHDGVSSADLTLLNQNRKYDGMFTPMDKVVIYLKRVKRVVKFTGYLDSVPLWTAQPGSINLRASCTLKRLANFLWDPTSPAAVALMMPMDPNAFKMEDGGLAGLAIRVLTKVVEWPESQIHIGRIPSDWYSSVAKVADEMIAEAEALAMASVAGGGAWVAGDNPVTAGTSTVPGIGPGTGEMPASSGRASHFGGPGGGAYGQMALTGESGVRPRDQWYSAMRWPYTKKGAVKGAKEWWVNRKILVTNPKTNKSIVVRAADWGPHISTGRVIDLSPGGMRALGAKTDDVLHMSFAPTDAKLGPVTKSSAGLGSILTTGKVTSTSKAGATGVSTGWGRAGDTANMVQAHAAGLTFTVHRLAKPNFEGFVNELVSSLGYHPKSIGGYNNRNIAGSSQKSNHAYGAAIDIDPSRNPRYGSASGGPYALPKPPAIINLARKWGLHWGGEYKNSKDYMHFEVIGAPSTPAVKGYKPGEVAAVVAKWTPPVRKPPGFTVTKRFGAQGGSWSDGHTGTDFAAPAGTNIYPVGPGVIASKGVDGSYGNYVSVDHGSKNYTFYAHMQAPSPLSVGASVDQDTVIGKVGSTGNSTGPHVHVEYRKGADTYAAAKKSGGIEKYVLGGANRSDPPDGTMAAAGDYAEAAQGGSGVDLADIGSRLFNVWQMTNQFQQSQDGTLLAGYRALMNDVPVLSTVSQFMSASMRGYCSAPNGDFIAWFPDYFGHFKQAGKMIVQPIEISAQGGPPTIGWSDKNLKTHQFVSGSTALGVGDADSVVRRMTTAGVASVEFPELMEALFHIPRDRAEAMSEEYLTRFGPRVNYQAMDQISGGRQEFFFACREFQKNFSQQYQARVELTFMPELFPGMLACFPLFGIQGYVMETTDTWDLRDGGGFHTTISCAPWSAIGGSKNPAVAMLPQGAPL